MIALYFFPMPGIEIVPPPVGKEIVPPPVGIEELGNFPVQQKEEGSKSQHMLIEDFANFFTDFADLTAS